MKKNKSTMSTAYSHSSVKVLLTCAMLSPAASITHADEEFTLEEVIVTAQKRAQSLQDVPISVNAVGGEKLSEAGIENLQDLSAYVPNLKIVEGGLTPQMYIRGIGSGTNQGFEQSVGTYSDGVYMGRSLQSRSSFLDLERVEVLRGPQSILFGQSSIAGAISLISAKPTDEFEAMIGVSHSPQNNETELNAYISGPLTDNLSARLALRDRQEDGYLTNTVYDDKAPNLDEQAVRLTLSWDVNDSMSTSLKLETAEIKRKGRTMQLIDAGDYPLFPGPIADGITIKDGLDLNYQSDAASTQMDFESDNIVLNVEYEFENGLTLTSITAHSEYDYQELAYDSDSSPIDLLPIDMWEEFDQQSQEFRLTSPGGATVDYILGAFYQQSEQQYQENATFNVSNLGLPLAPIPSNMLDSYVVRPFKQESKTAALFAQATWNITEEFRATLGLRYTRDEKEGSRSQRTYSLLTPGVLQEDVAIGGGNYVAHVLAGGFGLADHDLSGKSSKSNWTPSLNLQYDITSDIMLYATYTEGYKAGGYDARGVNGSTPADNPWGVPAARMNAANFQYDQEEAETIELGAKMTLLDGSAELNAAIYQTEYTDMQVSVFDGGVGYNVLNAASATVRGMELDGRWRPTENWMLSAGVAYLDFEWGEYEDAVCAGVGSIVETGTNCSLKGRENQQTPEWTASLSANHTLPLGDSLELRSTLDANFKDNHYAAGDLDARSEQSAATLYNMRVSLASADDTWQIALVGKNLTDKRIMDYNYVVTLSNLLGTDSDGNGRPDAGRGAQVNRPRTFAIEGSYRF